MLKPLLYAISTFAIAGTLAVGNSALAVSTSQNEPSSAGLPTTNGDTDEPRARFDAQMQCWVLEPPMAAIAGTGRDGDWDEPAPRFDAARECVAAENLPDPGIARDYDPEEPVPQPGG